jgi:putative ABC transport system substrate-binding protein
VKEPYRTIYNDILSGINSSSEQSGAPSSQIHSFVLTKQFDTEKIISDLRALKIKKVIVLGRFGYKLAKLLPKEFNVVSGALPISPNGVSGISLITDPAYLFEYLSLVAPNVKRIHIAYSKKSEWIIELAKAAAKEQGLELNMKAVTSTKEAVGFYQTLFESGVSKEDAIWLPVDRVSSHDKITLPIILEESWSKEVVVFSSKPSHARRGVLFSTYPDNYGLGKHLYEMLSKLSSQPQERHFSALSSLQLAVNLRTAAHLGLKYSSEEQQQFKLTFPQ